MIWISTKAIPGCGIIYTYEPLGLQRGSMGNWNPNHRIYVFLTCVCVCVCMCRGGDINIYVFMCVNIFVCMHVLWQVLHRLSYLSSSMIQMELLIQILYLLYLLIALKGSPMRFCEEYKYKGYISSNSPVDCSWPVLNGLMKPPPSVLSQSLALAQYQAVLDVY